MADKSQKTTRKRRRWLRVVLYTVTGVFLLLAVAVGITQTQWFRDYLRDEVVSQANESLNGMLSIESIKGNLFTRAELHGIRLIQTNDTVLAVTQLAVGYDLWDLLYGAIIIDSVRIESPSLYLRELEDSTWNIANLAPSDTVDATESDAEPFGFTVVIGQFRLVDGRVRIKARDSLIPVAVNDINLRATATWTDPQATLQIDEFRFVTEEPSFELQQLRAFAAMDESGVRVDSLVAVTRSNRIDAFGRYEFEDVPEGQITISASDIDAQEFGAFIPIAVPDVRPTLTLVAAVADDSLSLNLDVRDGERYVTIDGWLDGVSALTADSATGTFAYNVNTEFSLAGVDQWLPDTLITGDLNGTIRVTGTGFELGRAVVDARVRHVNGSVYQRAADSIRLDAVYASDTAKVQMTVRESNSLLALEGAITDPFDRVAYDVDFRARHLNLSKLAGPDAPVTDLNLDAHVAGQGIDPSQLTTRGEIVMSPSRIAEFRLDTLLGEIDYRDGLVGIDTLWVISDVLDVSVGGTIGLDRYGDLTIAATIADMSVFTEMSGAEQLGGRISVNSHVQGRLDSLAASGRIELGELVYDDYQLEEGSVEGSAAFSDSLFRGEYSINLGGIVSGDIPIDSVAVAGTFSPDVISAEVHVGVSDDLSVGLYADYSRDSVPRIDVADLSVTFGSERWEAGSDTARFMLHPDRYEVVNFRLRQPKSLLDEFSDEGQPSVAIDGAYYIDSTQQFRVQAEYIDIAPLASAYTTDMQAGGLLFLDVKSAGALENPKIQGSTRLIAARVNEYAFDSLAGAFTLADSVLDVDYTLHAQGPESLTVAGFVPLPMGADSAISPSSREMDLRIRSYGFTANILRMFGYTIENAEGDLQIDLHAYNTPSDPRVSGAVTVANGRVVMPDYGVDYRNIRANLEFDSSSAILEELTAVRDDGRLTVSGRAGFDGGIVSGQIDAAALRLQANKFYLVRHRHYEIRISADASVDGGVDSSQYGGTITVERSSFYLPVFSGETAAGAGGDLGGAPMLVRALGDSAVLVDTIPAEQAPPNDTISVLQRQFMQNLKGRLTVRFPRNTWLRDEDMRVEIGGEVEVVKSGAEFEVFGSIRVIRGYYELYGKRFTIKEGTLTFTGGEELNPGLNIDAEYVFRTPSREKKRLMLSITGKAMQPVLQFNLDGEQLSEGDALSYILFGRDLDELTSGQRSAIAEDDGGKGSMAKGAIANLFAGKLSEALGDEFALDVIEIEAQSDWKSASFVVGKYLTTDLFVSYQRGVGTARDQDEIVPEIVTLEYELSRYIYLQLVAADARNSGFDVILKFNRW